MSIGQSKRPSRRVIKKPIEKSMIKKIPRTSGGVRSSLVRLALIAGLAATLAACNNEGPFGNTPGPKKPNWNKQISPLLLLN